MIRIPDLSGKTVLVTGSSTGIGAAVAEAFAAQGARVAVHYNASADAAAAVLGRIRAAGGEAEGFQADVAARGAADRLVEDVAARFGGIDGLVNNAGGMVRRCPVVESDDTLIDEVVDLNIRQVINASRAVVPWMRRAGGGFIINTSSVAARNGGGPGAVLYASAKGFVSTFTRGLARELVGDRIRVNAVAPGLIATAFHERHSTPAQMEAMTRGIPMARPGTSEDCVGAYLYLASDLLSGYVTGQVVEVNGGSLMP